MQSVILAAIIVIAAVAGTLAYVLWSSQDTAETIKIGFFGDLDGVVGKPNWQGAILAVEEINAEGGILGRQVELFGEDDDSGRDAAVQSSALARLITYHEVDFIVGGAPGQAEFLVQDTIAQHKIICISVSAIPEEITQRVLDDYETFRYYFSMMFNATSRKLGMTGELIQIREMSGFNKVGYLAEDASYTKPDRDSLDVFLPENGFELVYKGTFPIGTVDFSSYFAAAEAAGVEVLLPIIALDGGIPFCKEYYDRQSPMFVFGVNLLASDPHGWEWTEGKCNHMAFGGILPTTAGYPFTSKTLQTRDAYVDRWGEAITTGGATVYESIKFILKDAIERAGTIETDAVIEALEKTSIETSNARNFVFTEEHSVMVGENPNDPNEDYPIAMVFQWQNGVQVPVGPRKIMEEAEATYTYPDWPGPWD